jgi:hypothetical protein
MTTRTRVQWCLSRLILLNSSAWDVCFVKQPPLSHLPLSSTSSKILCGMHCMRRRWRLPKCSIVLAHNAWFFAYSFMPEQSLVILNSITGNIAPFLLFETCVPLLLANQCKVSSSMHAFYLNIVSHLVYVVTERETLAVSGPLPLQVHTCQKMCGPCRV